MLGCGPICLVTLVADLKLASEVSVEIKGKKMYNVVLQAISFSGITVEAHYEIYILSKLSS